MEKTIDTLQPIIIEARNNLTRETRESIDSVNWKLIILEMAGKYNEEQLVTLETETELLLCGILSPEEYQKELGSRMMLTKEEVSLLLEEMDKLIFKKIQGELERKLAQQNIDVPVSSENSVFENNIRENSKTIIETKKGEIIKDEDAVPLPPYAAKKIEQTIESGMEKQKEIPKVEVDPIQITPKSAFEEKLKGPTISEHTVSDYSVQKKNTLPPTSEDKKIPAQDPYREAF